MEQKVANYSRLSEANAEDMQVLRYEISEEYRDHPDYLSLKRSTKEWELDGGNRVATVLIYIGLPEEGGETVFPKVPKPDWQVGANVTIVEKRCASNRTGYSWKTRMTRAVIVAR